MTNPLPNDKILDQSKLKAFADKKLKVIQMAKFVLDKNENIVGKEENAGYQHFRLFHQCFRKALTLTHSHTMTPFDASGKQAF